MTKTDNIIGNNEKEDEEEKEGNVFFFNIANALDLEDINTFNDKQRKTKSEKKKEKREILREKRKSNRYEEKKKKQKKKREELREILNRLNEEEKIIFLKKRNYLKLQEKENKKQFSEKSYNSNYKICLNCCFQQYMEEKEISSLGKQIFLSYHYMIKSKIPIQFNFSALNEKDPLYMQLQKYSFHNWKINIQSKQYWEMFPTDKIVVLSPDAAEELEEVKENEVYIIAALVDRSVSKNLSFYQASLHGFTTKKLPLERYIKKKKSSVLNVNTVIEILIHFIELKNWKQVFEKCLPQKKVLCFFDEAIEKKGKETEEEWEKKEDGEEEMEVKMLEIKSEAKQEKEKHEQVNENGGDNGNSGYSEGSKIESFSCLMNSFTNENDIGQDSTSSEEEIEEYVNEKDTVNINI